MTDDVIKKAEARGYSKGYTAGKRRKSRYITDERRQREKQAFAERCYLALLPALMTDTGWTMGGQPCNTGEKRIDLAVLLAKKAANKRFALT